MTNKSEEDVEEGSFECRTPGCTKSALVVSYYCKKHEEDND